VTCLDQNLVNDAWELSLAMVGKARGSIPNKIAGKPEYRKAVGNWKIKGMYAF
jgi:hypothetical protein